MEEDKNDELPTPIPLNEGANEQDLFSAGSYDGYEQIDLGGLFEEDKQLSASQTETTSHLQRSGKDKETGVSRRAKHQKQSAKGKRPLSAYNLFFKAIRPQVMEEMKDSSSAPEQLGRIIGQKWRNLSNEERQVYERQADEDILRYRAQVIQNEQEQQKRAAAESQFQGTARASSQGAAARRPPLVVRIKMFPPPPPGRYMGPAPDYLGLPKGETVHLVDKEGRWKAFEVHYACYSVKRSDLDNYLAQIPQQTDHHMRRQQPPPHQQPQQRPPPQFG